ncbi:MAG: CBS domain-containing protein [Pseudobacteriovorax sp.]|nr:CBS domain-containing protein [Pseudobacteriovorax sp.]
MKVKDIMTSQVTTVEASAKLLEAVQLLDTGKFGALPVVDDTGELVGIITESDFIGKNEEVPHGLTIPSLLGQWFHNVSVEEIFKGARDEVVGNVMTKDPHVVSSDAALTLAVKLMLNFEISRLPVVDHGKLVGIVSKKDVLKAVLASGS